MESLAFPLSESLRESKEWEMEFCTYDTNLMSEFVFRLVALRRLVVVSLYENDSSEWKGSWEQPQEPVRICKVV